MKCQKCNQTEKECEKKTVNQKPICNKCKLCFMCKQNENNNKKLLEKICCMSCCEMCKKCNKTLVKNNWPNDTIVNKLCGKCSHLCELCCKYTMDNKCVYKQNKRYCEKCFKHKFIPSNENEKYIICRFYSKTEVKKVFVEWKIDKIKFQCKTCNKYDWKNIKNKSIKCNMCKKNSNSNNDTTYDPSSDKEKYYLKSENIDGINTNQWILDKKRQICSTCCMSIWIKKENLCDKNKIYNCDKCKPIKINYKYKYNKNKQAWEYYSKKSRCIKCLKQKWVHIDNDSFATKTCNMCIKLKI